LIGDLIKEIFMPVSTQVIHILGRSGAKGVTRVRCKVLEVDAAAESRLGRARGKVLVRNVIGPVKMGDILMIPDVEVEAAAVIE